MSKLSKLIKSPRKFFIDARKKAFLQKISSLSKEEIKSVGLSVETLKSAQKEIAQASKAKSKVQMVDLLLANKLINFERIYPVNSLQGGDASPGLLLWPFIRHLLWVRCQAAYKGKDAGTVNTSKMYISSDWQKHYLQQLPVESLDTLDVTKCDFLFFTNLRGTEQTRIKGRIYNRITDPVFEVARTLGTAKKVEVIKSVGEIYPHRVHDAELILPPMLRKIGYAAQIKKPSDFISTISKHLPETKFNDKSFNDCIEWFFHQRDFYEDLLKRYNPKVIFFVGFDYHYALICAAKSLGIHTVDLQHGVQAGWSPVYNHWQAVPQQGYQMLPDTFWVWGEYDAIKISETFGQRRNTNQNVRALRGGFPWLDRQKDFIDERLPDELKKISEEKKVGLLTLQDQTILPELFSQIIKHTSDSIQWVIKRHPKHRNIDLTSVKNIAFHGDSFDSVSFATLVVAVDIHLTECSTAVIEADYFGVPSVVTGEQGILNYKDFIEQGLVYHVDSVEEFNEQLDSVLGSRGVTRLGVVDNSTLKQALKTLLEN